MPSNELMDDAWPGGWPPFEQFTIHGGERMSLQARFSEHDKRLYDPNRDVAHNFKSIVEHLAARIDSGRWEIANEVIKQFDVTSDDLGEACGAFIRFVASSTQNPKETMRECLDRSGFLKVKPAAQLVHMAYLGSLLAGVYFRGAREATLGGVGPCAGLEQYVADGVAASKLIGKGKKDSAPRVTRAVTSLEEDQVQAAVQPKAEVTCTKPSEQEPQP